MKRCCFGRLCFTTSLIMKFLHGQEDERRREEKDERKRKFNVKWNDEVCIFSLLS